MIGLFCTLRSICLNIGFWYVNFYRNDAFSILVLSTKKQYSSFLKNVFVFQKICSRVKVLKTFKVSTDCLIKTYRSLTRRVFWKPLVQFLEETMLFLLALKWKLYEKVLRQKPTQIKTGTIRTETPKTGTLNTGTPKTWTLKTRTPKP